MTGLEYSFPLFLSPLLVAGLVPLTARCGPIPVTGSHHQSVRQGYPGRRPARRNDRWPHCH
jgi:hypothetical protein